MEMSAKYYKCIWEGETSDGIYYSEVIDGEITRQIVEIEGDLKWATPHEEKDEAYFFTDQPEVTEEDLKFAEDNLDGKEISSNEFGELWKASQA
jgi:hypothetical protein